MVTKKQYTNDKEQGKTRAKVGKLQLNKETVKDLTSVEQQQIKGGQKPPAGDSERVTCTCDGCG